MTLIAIHNRTMVADCDYFCGGIRFANPVPKITRLPDGSLFGCGGLNTHTRRLRDWALAGMDFDKPPALIPDTGDHEGNNGKWLWLRPDGKAFYGDHQMEYAEVSPPEYLGTETAGNLWLGAVFAGVDPVEALRVVISRCIYVGGKVQVEHLDQPQAAKPATRFRPTPTNYRDEDPLTGKPVLPTTTVVDRRPPKGHL